MSQNYQYRWVGFVTNVTDDIHLKLGFMKQVLVVVGEGL